MMRKFVSVILLSVFSAGVSALGLGNIQLNSGLNQPFDAKIELLSPTASELDSLTVSLATVEAFERAGIDRAFVLGSLRFEIQQGDSGQDFVHVTSREPLREPFLNFLIEASWANGRLYRKYTVLLDPPLDAPYAGRPVTANTASESASANNSISAEPTGSDFSGNEVGPIAASETLWSVASRVRPDSSVTVNQMMLALFRVNPDAFIRNNINGLMQGQILRVPELGDINSTSYAAAVEEVRSQNALWEDIRGSVASTPVERPVSTSSEPASQATPADSVSVSAADTGSELRLLAPGDRGTIAGQATSATMTANADAGLGLMNEQVESLTSENSELRSRLTESETIIEDLKRLIDLKDDELATLQQQMGRTPADAEPVTVEAQTDSDYEPGLIDQILGFVFGNLLLAGGGLVAILLLTMVPSILRKRKEAGIDADQTYQIAFPDFNAAQTGSDATDGPQMDFDIDREAEAVASAPAQLADTLGLQSMPVEVTAAAPEVAEDVTAHSDMEAGHDEDVLDISMNPSALTDAPEFDSMGNTGSFDANLLDFDIGGLTETDSEVENALILDENDGGIELDFGTEELAEDGSLELSMDSASKDDDGGLSIDFETDSESIVDEGSLDLSMDLDVPGSSDGELELDFESDDSNPKSDVVFDLDLSLEEESSPSSSVEIDMDMDSTVKIPKSSMMMLESFELDNDDEDDEGDHTVFVARTNDAGEQSADDENATKLDLAKAYVELGDSDNAKSILEEVIAEGNTAQRRQAQELMTQIA